MAVTHKGQTYYVCCTGCRDMFNENPEKVIAEYNARKAAEKEKAKAQ
jgi:YHS domain-containing protein